MSRFRRVPTHNRPGPAAGGKGRRKVVRRIAPLLGVALLALAVVSCGSAWTGSSPEQARGPEETSGYDSVTVESCGRETTYTRPPERAVANDINIVEMMLALGLEDRMAGVAGVEGKGEILPEYREAFEGVPKLSEEYLPNKEVILGANADFVLAGWNYGFSEESGITPESLEEMGIDSYAIKESCIRLGDREPVSIEHTYEDIVNVGRIFGEKARARELVEGYKEQVEEVQARLPKDEEPLRVFVYDSGEEAPLTAGGEAMPQDLIDLAGGENIFADVGNSWTPVGWEEVVERGPEIIVIVDYGTPSSRGKIEFLKESPALEDVEAIREERFVVLSYAEATPGVRNAAAVEKLARAFYPEAF